MTIDGFLIGALTVFFSTAIVVIVTCLTIEVTVKVMRWFA